MKEAIGLTLLGFLAIFIDLLFLPGGFFVAGGIVTIVYAIYLTYQTLGILAATIHTLICLMVAPKLVDWALNRVALKNEMSREEGYVANPDLKQYIGHRGVVVGDLKPSGKVKLEGQEELFDCLSHSGFINDQTPVIITQAEAGRLVVEKENL